MSVAGGGTVRYRVVYSGRVQGVFFRATSRDLAAGRAIVGWVRNLADGNVETEVEGGEGEVGSFLSAVRGRFEGHITNEAVTSLPVRSDESGFVIRH